MKVQTCTLSARENRIVKRVTRGKGRTESWKEGEREERERERERGRERGHPALVIRL